MNEPCTAHRSITPCSAALPGHNCSRPSRHCTARPLMHCTRLTELTAAPTAAHQMASRLRLSACMHTLSIPPAHHSQQPNPRSCIIRRHLGMLWHRDFLLVIRSALEFGCIQGTRSECSRSDTKWARSRGRNSKQQSTEVHDHHGVSDQPKRR